MDVHYILLGGKTAELDVGVLPATFVAYGDKVGGGPDRASWSATSPHQNAPLAHLTEQAREAMWHTEGGEILKRHKATASLGGWLRLDPKMVVIEADLMQLGRPGAGSQLSEADAPALRDLQRIARQIISRKMAFVFPAKWPDSNDVPATELVQAMVKEVSAHFRYASVDEELPWTFLSLCAGAGDQGPLGDFIRSLHNEMLADTSDIKIADWRRKRGAILLSGPTGSGKSYAARLLAANMKNKAHLIEINLAAVSDELLESRMRGYEPGTFTGADRKARKGWFEEAHDGVLFLDEFQSVSPAAQVQLLDLLSAVSDDIHIARIGADHKRSHYNVKVILAINEAIEALLKRNRCERLTSRRGFICWTLPP